MEVPKPKKKAKEEVKPEEPPTPPTPEVEIQDIDLTPEQKPTIITNEQGETILTLKTTGEKLLYEIMLRLDTILHQNAEAKTDGENAQ